MHRRAPPEKIGRSCPCAHDPVCDAICHAAHFFDPVAGRGYYIAVARVYCRASTRASVEHINLALWGDLMLVAPATANTIAKIVHGIADDVVSSTVLALRCPLLVAPAMDVDMYLNEATQENLSVLRERGHHVLPPAEGELGERTEGPGRLPEPEAIVAFVEAVLSKTPPDLRGKKILVSAGPTYEPIDPVRFIGNRSSGKMGFALANAAAQRGAEVTLISGPVSLGTPKDVSRINVETAEQMYNAVMQHSKKKGCRHHVRRRCRFHTEESGREQD